MPKSLKLTVALALHGLRAASGVEDSAALIQQSVVRHEPSRTFTYQVGQRVELEGYPIDQNITIAGFGGSSERYHVRMDGYGNYMNVEGKFLKPWTTPFPASQDPQAGAVAHLMGFEYKGKPYIVSRGEKPNSWNVYVPGHGLVTDVDDGVIIRDRAWYKSTTAHPREHTVSAVLSGSFPSKEVRNSLIYATTTPEAVPVVEAPVAAAPMEAEPISLQKEAPQLAASTPAQVAPKEEEANSAPPTPAEKATLTRKLISLGLQGKGLGMTFKFFKGEGMHSYKEELLLVDSIEPNSPIAKWNAQHPFSRLNVGDRILSANGMGGSARKIANALYAQGNTTTSIKLVAEKPGMTAGEGAEMLFTNIKKYVEKGPKEFAREALPFELGKVLINSADTVQQCKDISSPLYCMTSQEKFGIACAGWSGADCLSSTEASCERIQTEAICTAANEKFGLSCAGWGGSACLSKGAQAKDITDADACGHAEKKLGIEVAGWGGSSCLARDAKCIEITLPGLCNNAEARLGLSCLGWGGDSCLDNGAAAELIASEALCKKSMEKFGIESAGWGGSRCLAKQDLKCNAITDAATCNHAQERLGISCAGWGGSSCLDVGAEPSLITAAAICQRSQQTLGIASGGWSGSACLPAGPVTCSSITHPGVCNDAGNRLGINCAGWSGKQCLAPEEVKCNKIPVQAVCEKAMTKLKVSCVWNGYECMPDSIH